MLYPLSAAPEARKAERDDKGNDKGDDKGEVVYDTLELEGRVTWCDGKAPLGFV